MLDSQGKKPVAVSVFDVPAEWQAQWAIRLYSASVVCPRPVVQVVLDLYGLSVNLNYDSYKSMIGDTNVLSLLHRPPVCRCCVDRPPCT